MALCRDQFLELIHILTQIICVILYIVAFASVGWVEDDFADYGLWKWCNQTGSCITITLASYPGYYEASRTLATFGLVAFCSSFVLSFLEDQPLDKGCKKMFYRYASCTMAFLGVILAIFSMIILGSGIDDDDNLSNPVLAWCFWLCFVTCLLASFSCFCRLRYIGQTHPTSIWACKGSGKSPSKTIFNGRRERRTEPSTQPDDAELGQGQGVAVVLERNADLPPNGRNQLPPLSIIRRNSSDSGLSSNIASRDSAREDQSVGKGRFSSWTVTQHRLAMRRLEPEAEERRHVHAFSSTASSPSSSDSESSAELAPRVHTPTDKKRVGFSEALNIARYNRPPPVPPSTDPVPPPPVYEDLCKKPTMEELAPPIISFPIKMRGVELSRATTTSKTTAFLDNVKLMSSVVHRWRRAAHEKVRRRSQVEGTLAAPDEAGAKARRKSKQDEKESEGGVTLGARRKSQSKQDEPQRSGRPASEDRRKSKHDVEKPSGTTPVQTQTPSVEETLELQRKRDKKKKKKEKKKKRTSTDDRPETAVVETDVTRELDNKRKKKRKKEKKERKERDRDLRDTQNLQLRTDDRSTDVTRERRVRQRETTLPRRSTT